MAYTYQSVTLNVANAQVGGRIAIELLSNGAEIGWSSGEPFQNYPGIQIAAEGSSLPLSEFSLTSTSISFVIPTGGSASLQFSVQLYLVADGSVNTFYLQANAGSGVQISAVIGASAPKMLTSQQTLCCWNPT